MLATATHSHSLEVLLAEDNGGDVRLIERALRQTAAPCRIHVLDNGVRALAFLRREDEYCDMPRPDVVILDLNLPRKGGLEVLSEVKRDPKLRSIPIVVLSSSRAEADVARAYESQATAFFVKPLSDYRTVVELIIGFIFAAERPARTLGALARVEQANDVQSPGALTSLSGLSRARLHSTIVECATDAIMSMNLDGTITSWNAAAERVFGYTAHEALGRLITEIIPDERLHWNEPSAAGSVTPLTIIDSVRVDRSGKRTAVSLTLSPLADVHGGLIGLAAIARDLTERKCHEEKFRLAVEAAPVATIMVDQHGAILLVNTATERLFGYARDELLGMSIEQLVPPRFRAEHPAHRESFIVKPQRRAMGGRDLYGMRKDGSEFPVEIGLNPITTAEGECTLGSIVDITERKQSQEALLERTKELLRSNSELEQFACVAAHDLQEPLRMVASYTRLLSDDYASRLGKEGQLFVHFARDGAERMQQLIHDLLAYSRIGSFAGQSRLVSAQTCLDNALQNLSISLEETDCVVRATGLPNVVTDPVQLAELFQNLISNAIKFRSARDPLIEVSCETNAAGSTFAVRDNGIGMEPQYFEEVFKVFKRLHSKEEYPGTGIGLAICKRVVERSGGRIWVESTPGQGSTFYFTVPSDAAQS